MDTVNRPDDDPSKQPPRVEANDPIPNRNCEFPGVGPRVLATRHNVLQRIIDWIFGYDYFISYKHADGGHYPTELTNQLEIKGFKVFLDERVYLAGDELNTSTRRRVRMSKYLVLIARPRAMARSPWVLQEVKECINARRTPIVISIDCAFERTNSEKQDEKERISQLRILLGDYIRIFEASPAQGNEIYDGDPDPSTIKALIASFNGLRQTRKRRRVAVAIISLFLIGFLTLLYQRADAHATSIAEDVFRAAPHNAQVKVDLISADRLHWWIDYKIMKSLETTSDSIQQRSANEPSQSNEAEDDVRLSGMITAALVILKRGHEDNIWQYFSTTAKSDHRLRSLLIHWMWSTEFPPESLYKKFKELSANRDPYHNGIRQAILIAIGKYPSSKLTQKFKNDVLAGLENEYKINSDAGVHSAITWLGMKWNAAPQIQEWDKALQLDDESKFLSAFLKGQPTHGWFVSPFGLTMVVVPPGQYWVSSRILDSSGKSQIGSTVRIASERWFAISTTEITNDQFKEFADRAGLTPEELEERTSSSDPWLNDGQAPATMISWPLAMRFCDWLTVLDQHPRRIEDLFLKPDTHRPDPNRSPSQSFGYRLPTELEWEIASRAGTSTSRFCANDTDVLADYAWSLANSPKDGEASPHAVRTLMPNPLGMFDIYGNAEEWCLDKWTEEFPANRVQWVYSDQDRIRAIRPARGGACDCEMREIASYARQRVQSQAQKYVGLRVAKTLPEPLMK